MQGLNNVYMNFSFHELGTTNLSNCTSSLKQPHNGFFTLMQAKLDDCGWLLTHTKTLIGTLYGLVLYALTAAGICQENVLDMVTLIDLKVKEELFVDWSFFLLC
jgi:hypothetical protein